MTSVPEPGQLVSVRQRHYVVLDVAESMLPADPTRNLQMPNRPAISSPVPGSKTPAKNDWRQVRFKEMTTMSRAEGVGYWQ